MTIDLKIQNLQDQANVANSGAFYKFGSDMLPNTEAISQTFKIAASATNTAVTLQTIDAGMTRFAFIEDLSGGNTITCKVNGGATSLGVTPHLLISQDLDTISFSNSDTENPIYVRVVRGSAGAATGAILNTGSIAPILTVTITDDIILTINNRTVLIDATDNDVDVTLPPASSMSGRTITLTRIDVSDYIVTAIGASGEDINLDNTYDLSNQQSIDLFSNGVQWYIQ
jgi:hypothetical protein